MSERFEENLGKYTYITIPQVKDYLSISSNTADARLANIISYTTGVIEHYIGQQVLANDYVEVFDGGSSSVYVNRLPLSTVYSVSEFNGVDYTLLADPTTSGSPVDTSSESSIIEYNNSAHNTTRVKRFGKASLKLDISDYISVPKVIEELQHEESNYTLEMFIRVDEDTLQANSLVRFNTDADNYLDFGLSNQRGLYTTAVIDSSATTVTGANTDVETQQFAKRRWAHVAVTRNLEEEKVYLHYNGNVIADASFAVSNLSFTSNIHIGSTFKGYIDDIKFSQIARYSTDFTPPTHRSRTDNDTTLLIRFDESNKSTNVSDVHAVPASYNFSRDVGEVTKDLGGGALYPALTLHGSAKFSTYPQGVHVSYRAGFEPEDVPQDLQLATLDYIKTVYKQDQSSQLQVFEGERKEGFALSANFPPHIKRVLDLYRIIF